jgi:DNA polymerase-3 subunit epsilon
VVVRYGRLAAAGRARRGTDPTAVADALCASGETVLPAPGPLPGASAEETRTVLAFVDDDATRLVRTSAPWAQPARGAGRWLGWAQAAAAARNEAPGYDHRRAPRAGRSTLVARKEP